MARLRAARRYQLWRRVARGTKISSSDPPLAAVFAPYATQPLLISASGHRDRHTKSMQVVVIKDALVATSG